LSENNANNQKGRQHKVLEEANMRNHDVAQYYSSELSKEAVGSLFRESDDEALTKKLFSGERVSPESDDGYLEYISRTLGRRSADPGKEEPDPPIAAKTLSDSDKVELGLSVRRKAPMTLSSKGYEVPEDEKDDSDVFNLKDFLSENVKLIAVVSGILVLIIFASLIFTINSLNRKLAAANNIVEQNADTLVAFELAKIDLADLNNQVLTLTSANEALRNELDNLAVGDIVQVDDPQTPGAPPATDPPVTAPPAAAGGTYTVKDGDTIWDIAARVYGRATTELSNSICDANGLDRNRPAIRAGMVLKIP